MVAAYLFREQHQSAFERSFARLAHSVKDGSNRRIDALSDEFGFPPYSGLLRHRNEPPLRADGVEKGLVIFGEQ